MRIVGYRWDELAEGCRMDSRLNVQWQRTFGEASVNGFSIESFPLNREILVFEGDSEEIRRIQRLVEQSQDTNRDAG